MSDYFLQFVALSATAVIFFRVEPVINRMGPKCRMSVRVAFWAILVGAVGLGVSITQGYRPNAPTALFALGVAGLLMAERRVQGLLRSRDRIFQERRNLP